MWHVARFKTLQEKRQKPPAKPHAAKPRQWLKAPQDKKALSIASTYRETQ
jgi:hypothetical protein